jgi:hypothetical protein
MDDFVKGSTISKLKGADTFKVWRIQILSVLDAKGLSRYVDGSLKSVRTLGS